MMMVRRPMTKMRGLQEEGPILNFFLDRWRRFLTSATGKGEAGGLWRYLFLGWCGCVFVGDENDPMLLLLEICLLGMYNSIGWCG
jgi:hypothetical protein